MISLLQQTNYRPVYSNYLCWCTVLAFFLLLIVLADPAAAQADPAAAQADPAAAQADPAAAQADPAAAQADPAAAQADPVNVEVLKSATLQQNVFSDDNMEDLLPNVFKQSELELETDFED